MTDIFSLLHGIFTGSHDHTSIGHDHSSTIDNFDATNTHDLSQVSANHGDHAWLNFDGPHHQPDVLHGGDHHTINDFDHGAQVLGSPTDVPWLNFGSHDAHAGTEHGDAVSNAAHAASGASNHPVGAFSSGVPWQQITPDAIHHDTDGDGIPDALDNHVGYGKE